MKRKTYLDNYRWMIILLLVPYHAAQAFNTWGEPNYVFFTPDKVIAGLIVFFAPFLMPFMFLAAGMSTRFALQTRSAGQYLAERVKRLLLPLVFGTLVLAEPMTYLADRYHNGYDGGYFAHYEIFFTKITDLTGADGGFSFGQFWFLLYLFAISLVSLAVISVSQKTGKRSQPERPLPLPLWALILIGIPLPLLHELLSVGGKSFAEYLFIFLLGYYVFSRDDVTERIGACLVPFLAIGLASGGLSVYFSLWARSPYPGAGTVTRALCEWFMLLAMTGMGERCVSFQGKAAKYLTSRSYLFFSLHFLPLILFQYLMSGVYKEKALLYLAPVVLSYIVTFALCEIVIRIPVLTYLLGVRKKGASKPLSNDP